MKERKISIKKSQKVEMWCALVMQFFLYHSVACTALATIYEEEQLIQYLRLLLLFVPLCYLALVRDFVKTFSLYLLLHVPPAFMIVLLDSNLGEETVVTVCVAVMIIASVHAGTKKKKQVAGCPAFALIVVLLICHYMGYYLKQPLLIQLSSYEIQLYLVLHLVHESLSNTSRFIQLHSDTANFPVGQMTIINRLLMILFLTVLAVSMYIFPRLHLEVILMPILQGLLAVLAWLLSFISLPEASGQVERASQQLQGSSLHELVDGSTTSLFWVFIEQILKVVVAAAVVVMIVGGIAYVLYRMYRGFYSERRENTDEKEFLVGEIKWFSKDWLDGLKKEREERGTVNQRIRRVYRRYVKKGFKRKESVPEAMTPEELLIFLRERHGGMGEAERCRVREIYESARYGQLECTADDLEEIKRLLNRI